MQITWKIWNILTFVPVVPINILPHKCVKSAKTRRYPRDSRDNLAAEGSPKSRIGHQRRTTQTITQPHKPKHNHTNHNTTKHTHHNTATHHTDNHAPHTPQTTTFFPLSSHQHIYWDKTPDAYLSQAFVVALFRFCQTCKIFTNKHFWVRLKVFSHIWLVLPNALTWCCEWVCKSNNLWSDHCHKYSSLEWKWYIWNSVTILLFSIHLHSLPILVDTDAQTKLYQHKYTMKSCFILIGSFQNQSPAL